MAQKAEKSENPKVIAGGITQAQLDKWEKEFKDAGGVTIIEVEDRQGVTYTAYFKPLEATKHYRNNYSVLSKKFQQQDVAGAGEFLRKTLWLGGDEIIKTNDRLAIAVETQLMSTIELAEARVVKK